MAQVAGEHHAPHPILKKKKESKPKKAIVWDEDNLEETSKDRGTRMKIDHPETPYIHPGDYSVSESDEEEEKKKDKAPAVGEQEKLHEKLAAAQKKQEAGVPIVQGAAETEKHKNFLHKREELEKAEAVALHLGQEKNDEKEIEGAKSSW